MRRCCCGRARSRSSRCALFNSRGQLLKETPATFHAGRAGQRSARQANSRRRTDAAHVATIVTAKVGDLTARARIRIVPPLPWKFDFEGLKDAPITWVGARYRHVLRQVDGSNAMVKITTIPLGTRSRLSMGQSDLHDYTIQADFKAAVRDDKMPDVGVIAQGYTLEVSGENKWLKLVSWMPHDKRTQKELPFELAAGSGTRSSCGPPTRTARRCCKARFGSATTRSRRTGRSN